MTIVTHQSGRPDLSHVTALVIDRDVAESMRKNGYDLRDYAERNWKTLGPKLAGRLHFFAGDMDDFFLNLAVYKFEEFARATTDPVSDAATLTDTGRTLAAYDIPGARSDVVRRHPTRRPMSDAATLVLARPRRAGWEHA